MVAHALFVVIEPPGAAVLELTAHAALEGAHDRFDHHVVCRMQRIENGLWQKTVRGQCLQKARELFGRLTSADRVASGIRSLDAHQNRMQIALYAKVQLHDPVSFGIFPCEEEQQEAGKRSDLIRGQGLPRKLFLQDRVRFPFRNVPEGDKVKPVIGDGGTVRGKEIHPAPERQPQGGNVFDDGPGRFGEPLQISGKVFLFDVERRIRAEGGQHLCRKGGIPRDLPVPPEIIRWVVRRAQMRDTRRGDEAACAHGRVFELFVTGGADLLCVLRVQRFRDAKITGKLEMRPVEERIADRPGEGIRKGEKLVLRVRVPGNQRLVTAVCAHQTPFVMVAGQPQIRDIVKAFVDRDLFGRQMTMIVDDRERRGVIVIVCRGPAGREKEAAFCRKIHTPSPPVKSLPVQRMRNHTFFIITFNNHQVKSWNKSVLADNQ